MLDNEQQQNKLNGKAKNNRKTPNAKTPNAKTQIQPSGHTDHPLVSVKKSKIHGQGLFARKDIRAGDVIGEVKGKPTKVDGPYVLWLNNAKQGFEVSCILRYINHHQEANACYYDDLTVVALKDIKKGEEITHNYGEDWS